MADLKLPKLPDRTPVKVTISLAPDLHALLVDYLTVYRAAYQDDTATIGDLVPAMIASFIESDRGFSRSRKG